MRLERGGIEATGFDDGAGGGNLVGDVGVGAGAGVGTGAGADVGPGAGAGVGAGVEKGSGAGSRPGGKTAGTCHVFFKRSG